MKKENVKSETPQDWEKAKNFIPKKDQIIIYEGVKHEDTYVTRPRLKIGDGVHSVNDLPFEDDQKISYIPESRTLLIN